MVLNLGVIAKTHHAPGAHHAPPSPTIAGAYFYEHWVLLPCNKVAEWNRADFADLFQES